MSDRLSEIMSRNIKFLLNLWRPDDRITDWNGHCSSGKDNTAVIESRMATALLSLDLDDDTVKRLSEADGPFAEPVVLGKHWDIVCNSCGQEMTLATDGKTVFVAGEPCPYPKGRKHYDVELDVPSGVLAVANDLRPWYPMAERHSSLNYVFGKIEYTKLYAKIGMATGFVGNSCPSLYPIKGNPDKYVIAGGGGRKTYGEPLASICTDLWWYSMADGDDLKRRMAHYGGNDPDTTYVNVRPGVYRVRWFVCDGYGNHNRFAEIKWLRKPDPVVDHLAADIAEHLTALEVCIQHTLYRDRITCADWAAKSQEQRVKDLATAAEWMLFHGGIEMHENGHVREVVTDEVKTLARAISSDGVVPKFEGVNSWGYLHRLGSTVLDLAAGRGNGTPITLNDSFALLALNCLQNFIENPPYRGWRNGYTPEHLRKEIFLALEIYQGIRARHKVAPMDLQFDELALGERAEEFIKNLKIEQTDSDLW